MGAGISASVCCCSSQANAVVHPTTQGSNSRASLEKDSEADNSDHDENSNQDTPAERPSIQPADCEDTSSGLPETKKRVSVSIQHESKELPPVPCPPKRADSLVKFIASVTGKETPLASTSPEDVKARKDTLFSSQLPRSLSMKRKSSWRTPVRNSRRSSTVQDLEKVDDIRQRRFAPLWAEYYRFLVNWVAMLDYGGLKAAVLADKYVALAMREVAKPKMETRQFKSHTMDNIRVRHMVDELLYLENPLKHQLPQMRSQTGSVDRELGWMPTLQASLGKQIHSIKITNNPGISIGGYFIMSQMLATITNLLSLDLSHNGITSADIRVLSLGLLRNRSIQDLRLKSNRIGSEGAISLAEVLQRNDTLSLLDIRSNQIRGTGATGHVGILTARGDSETGICLLVSAMADNQTLTHLDVRWNFSGQRDEYISQAMLDMQAFCYRNHVQAIRRMAEQASRAEQLDLVQGLASPRIQSPVSEHRRSLPPDVDDAALPESDLVRPQAQAQAQGSGAQLADAFSSEVQAAGSSARAALVADDDCASDSESGPATRRGDGVLRLRRCHLQEASAGHWQAHSSELNMPADKRHGDAPEGANRPGDSLKDPNSGRGLSSVHATTYASQASVAKQGVVPKFDVQDSIRVPLYAQQDAWAHHVLHKAGLDWNTTRSNDPIGWVDVVVSGASNLPQVIWTSGKDNEYLGMPQAYSIVKLGGRQGVRTNIMKKDFTPFWNFEASFDVTQIWQVFSVTIMHSRKLSQTHKDDYKIGMIHVPVGEIQAWRGVVRDADGKYKAYHKMEDETEYRICAVDREDGQPQVAFDTPEEAAAAYDKVAEKHDKERGILNFSGDARLLVGQHVMEQSCTLFGEDGSSVVGVQMGVNAACSVQLKYFALGLNYLEIHLERATDLPRMDGGLGSADPYCILTVSGYWGTYPFRSRVVRNSLDPEFNQTFRLAVPFDASSLTMKVDTYDWDRFDEDDLIGSARVNLISLLHNRNANLDGPVPLRSADKHQVVNARGTRSCIHFRYTTTFDEEFAGAPSSGSGCERASSQVAGEPEVEHDKRHSWTTPAYAVGPGPPEGDLQVEGHSEPGSPAMHSHRTCGSDD